MAAFWDDKVKRYRNENGSFISRTAVREAYETVEKEAKRQIREATQALRDGKINLTQWEITSRDQIKAMHTYAAAQSGGGLKNMTLAQWGKVGADTKKQYQLLAQFARDVKNGKQPLNGRMATRAEMYVSAARTTADSANRRIQASGGATEGRRTLHAAESCEDCIGYAAQGWMPLEELPAIGASICKTNCKCQVIYR